MRARQLAFQHHLEIQMKYALSFALSIVGLWLLFDVSWKGALGVFLFVWANNISYSAQLAKQSSRRDTR